MGALAGELGEWLARPAAEVIAEGLSVVIAGPPNAGKSTLINALAQRELAIVSPVAGTTRDVIETPLALDGIAMRLSDTAGLRAESTDDIEIIGIDRAKAAVARAEQLGRWPANVLLDGEAARLLDGQSGITESNPNPNPNPNPNFKNLVFGRGMGGVVSVRNQHSDSGGCSRFFYTSKASRSERELGLEALPAVRHGKSGGAAAAAARGEDYDNGDSGFNRTVQVKNHHPTVKPVDLMRWLCRLVTPPGGVVLDPFCGSGSTGIAALEEGFGFIGMDLEAEYLDIAEARIRATLPLFASQLQRVPT